MKEYSLKELIPHFDSSYPVDWDKLFKRKAPLEVEIGFGLGEYLSRLAQEFPQKNFVGFEQEWQRIFKALQKIDFLKPSADNLKILALDARIGLRWLFSPESIDRIYCLFPCPWPKTKHIHHRLFSLDFLALANNRLKQKGELKIVTDFFPYGQWILGQIPEGAFEVKTRIVQPAYQTKYERKWLASGKEQFLEIQLIKNNHLNPAPLKVSGVKSFKLKNFDPDRFSTQVQRMRKAEPSIVLCHDPQKQFSVIYKDMLFDRGAKRALIQALVVEEHLRQYLWIEILKTKGIFWRLHKAKGQQLFLTPGINRALEVVYDFVENREKKV